MKPVRLRNAFFRELVIFDDLSQNRHKHLRFRAMADKLLSHVNVNAHPGVFVLRGDKGELRLLRNELELAERLRERRGFRIIDPAKSDVPTIVAACAGARTVIGIEAVISYMASMYCSRVVRCWSCSRLIVSSASSNT